MLDQKLIRGVLAKAKLVMTDKQYRAFELRYSQGRSVFLIAAELGCSESNVYCLLRKAKNTMKANWR